VSGSRDGHVPQQPLGPTDELLLAQALETCLRAERVIAGSSAAIVARVPDSAREELVRLLEVARAVEAAAATASPSPAFREAARERLMRRISGVPEEVTQPFILTRPSPLGGGRARRTAARRWFLRSVGGLVAAGLTAAATLTASASALPGEPLYGVKQAREEVAVRMAADDEARALALLLQANARLDETTRLLQQGRTQDAVQTAQRYDDSVDRATSTLLTALGPEPMDAPAAEQFANEIEAQQARIQNALPEAPEPAQAELREALVVTDRGRSLARRPLNPVLTQALSPSPPAAAPALAPLVQPKVEEPRAVPTATMAPPPTAIVVEPEPEPVIAGEPQDRSDNLKEDRNGPSRGQARGGRGPSATSTDADGGSDGDSGSNASRGGPPPQVARSAVNAAPVVPRPVVVVQPRGGDDGASTNNDGPGGGDDRHGGEAEVQAPVAVNAPAPQSVPAVVQTRGQDDGDGGNRGGPAITAAQPSGSTGANTSQGDRGGDGSGRGDQSSNNRPASQPTAAPVISTPVPTNRSGDGDAPRPAPTATPVRLTQTSGSNGGTNTQSQTTSGGGQRTTTTSSSSSTSSTSSSSGSRSGSDDGGSHGGGGH
jgi:uncharacterized protein DUF5667